jgi:hypothetical protein
MVANGRLPDPCVRTNARAVRNNWAAWPVTFDVQWITDCLYYKRKDST